MFVVDSAGLIHTVLVVMMQCRQATSILQHSSVYHQSKAVFSSIFTEKAGAILAGHTNVKPALPI